MRQIPGSHPNLETQARSPGADGSRSRRCLFLGNVRRECQRGLRYHFIGHLFSKLEPYRAGVFITLLGGKTAARVREPLP